MGVNAPFTLQITALILIPTLFIFINHALGSYIPEEEKRFPVKLISVTDGDTVVLDFHGRVSPYRIRFIDTPELRQPEGEAAAAKLATLLHNAYLEFSIDDSNTASYSRNVCFLYANGEDVGLEMVRSGWAHIDTQFYVAPEYIEAHKEAVHNRNGIFKKVEKSGKGYPQHPRRFMKAKTKQTTGVSGFHFSEADRLSELDPNL